MDSSELINQAKRIMNSRVPGSSKLIESLEFLRVYAGEKSTFYQKLSEIKQASNDTYIMEYVAANLNALHQLLTKWPR